MCQLPSAKNKQRVKVTPARVGGEAYDGTGSLIFGAKDADSSCMREKNTAVSCLT
jgi:hypothetical protein